MNSTTSKLLILATLVVLLVSGGLYWQSLQQKDLEIKTAQDLDLPEVEDRPVGVSTGGNGGVLQTPDQVSPDPETAAPGNNSSGDGGKSSGGENTAAPSESNAPPTSETGPLDLNGGSGALPAPAQGVDTEPGVHTGGLDMNVGVWYTLQGCAYSLNGETGPLQNGGSSIVEIRKGDKFVSQCTWKAGWPPMTNAPTYGWHAVGKDMEAGTWSPTGDDCGIGLMRDLRGDHVNEGAYSYLAKGQQLILVNGDILYSTVGCKSWTR